MLPKSKTTILFVKRFFLGNFFITNMTMDYPHLTSAGPFLVQPFHLHKKAAQTVSVVIIAIPVSILQRLQDGEVTVRPFCSSTNHVCVKRFMLNSGSF